MYADSPEDLSNFGPCAAIFGWNPEGNFSYTSARQGALEHLFSRAESGWTLSLKSLA